MRRRAMAEYAVLIPWVQTEDGEALLLEIRSDKVRQPGEVCFPGGRMEPGETPRQTAVRETCEELGIRPEMIEILSEREPEVMGDGRTVYPVEARLRAVPDDLKLSEDEVSDVFTVSRSWFRSNGPRYYDLSVTPDEMLPAELRRYLANYAEFRRTGGTDYWEYEGRGIWGLTARIIRREVQNKWDFLANSSEEEI